MSDNVLEATFQQGPPGPPGPSSVWGGVSGTLSDQTDLQTALDSKADSSHTHAIADVTGLQAALDGAASTDHNHTLSQITDSGTAAALDVPATGDAGAGEVVKGDDTRLTDPRTPTAHSHPISEVTNLQSSLDGKAAASHTHTLSEVTDAGTAATLDFAPSGDASTTQAVKGDDTRLTDSRAPTTHSHPISEVTNLQNNLDAKLTTADLETALASVASGARTSLDVYSQAEADALLGGKANTAHTHAIGDVTNLQASLDAKQDNLAGTSDVPGLDTALAGKSETGHGHAVSDVTNLQTLLDGKQADLGAGTDGQVWTTVSGSGAWADAAGGAALESSPTDQGLLYYDGASEKLKTLQYWRNSNGHPNYQGNVGYIKRIGSNRIRVDGGGAALVNFGGATLDLHTYYGKVGVGGDQINPWAPGARFAVWDSAGPQVEHRFDADSSVYSECDDSENLTWSAETSTGKVLHKNMAVEDLALPSPTVPSSATDTGTPGQIAWDSDYFYVYTATNTWKRTALATW